jgi:hypothetical protein
MRNRPAANGTAIRIFEALTTPTDNSETAAEFQARCVARRFFLSPDIAATIARLHFGEALA